MKIQTNEFVSVADVNIDKIEEEKRDEETEITQLFGTKQTQICICLKCKHEVLF